MIRELGSNQGAGGHAIYRWGDVIRFTEGGNAALYCMEGWARPESGIIWTQNLNARLSFTITPPKGDISFVISCLPFLGDGKVAYQELHVFANFLRVGFATIKMPGEIEFRIPARVFNAPQLDIDLYLPKACSPASLGDGRDIRDLGLAVNEMILVEN